MAAADEALDSEALERLQLQQWAALSTAAKIDFFEEMVQLAYSSGALRPERLALRDQSGPMRSSSSDTSDS